MTDAKRKGGRQSLWRPEYVEHCRKMALLGWTDKQQAEHLGVSDRTFANWKNEFPELVEVLRNKDIPDANVVNALYESAIGAEWEEEQAIKVKVSQHVERVEIVKVKRKAPPNALAGMYWLNNRRKLEWSRVPENRGGGDDDKPEDLATALSKLADKLPS
jgi:hypothetical protein